MKMAKAIEIGTECGLETPQECFNNIILHGLMIFPPQTIEAELTELEQDLIETYGPITENWVIIQ